MNRNNAHRSSDVLTVESGAPNCVLCDLAKRSYAKLFGEFQISDAGQDRIGSSLLASITGALATASSSTLTLNAHCEGRGKRFQAGKPTIEGPSDAGRGSGD